MKRQATFATVLFPALVLLFSLQLPGQEVPPTAIEQGSPAANPADNAVEKDAAGPDGSANAEAAPENEKGRRVVPLPRLNVPPPPPAPGDYVVSSNVELVLLDVSVKDTKGGFASGLTKDNFRVYEDNKSQPITVFSAQDVPVTVGIVMDNSGSVRPKRPEIITAALTFATHSNPHDEMFLVNFNDVVKLGLPEGTEFTDDRNVLRTALLSNPVQGRTSLYDGLKLALQHLTLGTRDKKTLVLVSDGGDNASQTTEDEICRLARESTATIYTIGIFNPDDKSKNPGFLKHLASITGGEYFEPGVEHLVQVCERIAKDIRNRYTIGYEPPDLTLNGKPHKIRVIASAPGHGKLKVRTRTEYVAVKRGFSGRKESRR